MQDLVPIRMPPRVVGRGPTLATMHEIERILRRAQLALSLNEIRRRMSAKAVPHRTVRVAIDELKRLGLAVEVRRGVLWAPEPDDPAVRRRLCHERLA